MEMEKIKTVNYMQDESVVVITINRPEAMNSFNAQLRLELLNAIERASQDNKIRAVIINGKGRNFSAGADLKNMEDAQKTLEEVLDSEYRPIFDAIGSIEKPVIASIHGSAAGIGLSRVLVYL